MELELELDLELELELELELGATTDSVQVVICRLRDALGGGLRCGHGGVKAFRAEAGERDDCSLLVPTMEPRVWRT